ncbi:Uncharacterised protein [Dermatophilus congolensis]|uniref:Uncharacterized protein n=1 Tax=Dermatophilus congolensis TaxID=1863 RepID=A0A239VR86_9MICO|nr:Uncharacterised protein [Dermatophilus congolensis]
MVPRVCGRTGALKPDDRGGGGPSSAASAIRLPIVALVAFRRVFTNLSVQVGDATIEACPWLVLRGFVGVVIGLWVRDRRSCWVG